MYRGAPSARCEEQRRERVTAQHEADHLHLALCIRTFLQWASIFVFHMASISLLSGNSVPLFLQGVSFLREPLTFSLSVVRMGLLSWIQRWSCNPGLGKGNSRDLAAVISAAIGTFSKLFCGEWSLGLLLEQLGYFLSN